MTNTGQSLYEWALQSNIGDRGDKTSSSQCSIEQTTKKRRPIQRKNAYVKVVADLKDTLLDMSALEMNQCPQNLCKTDVVCYGQNSAEFCKTAGFIEISGVWGF